MAKQPLNGVLQHLRNMAAVLTYRDLSDRDLLERFVGTRDEAAQQLGLSSGSLHGRLERARDMLRERLVKRGLILSAVMSAAVLGESVARAALAPTFVVSSTKAAMLLAVGQPLTEIGVTS